MLENYKSLDNNVITQIHRTPFQYGLEYSKNYDKLGELGKRMSYLRLGYLLGVIKNTPKTLLDIGYGNGDFLSVASDIIEKCYGSDIDNTYHLPKNVTFVDIKNMYENFYDVICLFDVLEHFDDIYDIRNLKTDIFYVSLPNCCYKSDEWFNEWKHRKPNEHLWFFNDCSLKNFFDEIGYRCLVISNVEDIIRKDSNNSPNILTGVFIKK